MIVSCCYVINEAESMTLQEHLYLQNPPKTRPFLVEAVPPNLKLECSSLLTTLLQLFVRDIKYCRYSVLHLFLTSCRPSNRLPSYKHIYRQAGCKTRAHTCTDLYQLLTLIYPLTFNLFCHCFSSEAKIQKSPKQIQKTE